MVAKSFPTSPRPLASKAFVWGGCLWRVSYCAKPVLSPSLLLAVPNCRQMDAPDTISDFLDTFTSVMSIMPLKLHKKHQWRIDSNSDLFPVELWALLSTKNWNRKFQIEVNSGNREFLSIVGGKPLARPVGTLTSHILNVSYSNTLLASTIRLITVQCVATIDQAHTLSFIFSLNPPNQHQDHLKGDLANIRNTPKIEMVTVVKQWRWCKTVECNALQWQGVISC